ncbi:Crp/Fnr family transcriptional regulator [Emticicia sp. C21]|uniref:Crp/Fnr family transcriptional regulator n=1 Tax=Emticicia sp. C21 TaxID=2302915 RepID=UPI000E355880|nr:Crp/Fnr family transcriptional regulator [Emticicia sp. C21]RFS16602.1 Crp/Fnr family transcriptional regulator [Emticicia sp. C21]
MIPAEKAPICEFISKIYPMSQEQLASVVEYFKPREFQKNDFVLEEGRVCQIYYFMEEGFMRAYTYDHDGNEVTTALYSSRQIVCDLSSFFKRIPAQEYIQTLTDCKLWYITFEELQHVFHAMPYFREFGRMILVNSYAQLKQRMLSMLQETAETRYAKLIETNPMIFQKVPLKMIASYIGVTDTSLSRIRKEYAKNRNNN